MRSLFYFFAAGYLATTLLTSGFGHAVQFRWFQSDLRSHKVLPPRSIWLAAALITLLELAAGTAAVRALLFERQGVGTLLVSFVLGLAFLAYVVKLLSAAVPPQSCGCSVIESPLTPASVAPATGLILAALLGLAVTLGGERAGGAQEAALGVAWGITLAGLTLLLPATMPEMHKVRR